jgi:hypothetical protein
MDEITSGTLKTPSNAEVGENRDYDKSALKGYNCESKLKRIVREHEKEIKEYLLERFKIPEKILIRSDEPKESKGKSTYDEFDVVDIITYKLRDFNSKKCIQLWDIYDVKGLKPLINAIQYLSPIQKI